MKGRTFYLFVVDGNFGPWSAWSSCSATCGGGAMNRFRNCSDPVPTHGGRGCERIGASFEVKSCGESLCPGRKLRGQNSSFFVTISVVNSVTGEIYVVLQ